MKPGWCATKDGIQVGPAVSHALAPQIDKFNDLARELEADQDEEAFVSALRKVDKAKALTGAKRVP